MKEHSPKFPEIVRRSEFDSMFTSEAISRLNVENGNLRAQRNKPLVDSATGTTTFVRTLDVCVYAAVRVDYGDDMTEGAQYIADVVNECADLDILRGSLVKISSFPCKMTPTTYLPEQPDYVGDIVLCYFHVDGEVADTVTRASPVMIGEGGIPLRLQELRAVRPGMTVSQTVAINRYMKLYKTIGMDDNDEEITASYDGSVKRG